MSREIRGALLTMLGGACWGFVSVAAKFLVSDRSVPPAWMISLRLIIAGLVLLAMASRRPGMFDIWKDRASVERLMVVAIFAFAVCQTTYFMSVGYSNPGAGATIQQTAPVFVVLYTVVIQRRLPHRIELISLVTVMAGAFVLATHGDLETLVIPGKAIFWGFVSAITCACYEVMPAPLISRYGTYPAVGWGMLIGGIFLAPFCRLWEVRGEWDTAAVLAFAYIVTIGTIVAFGCFLYGVTLIGPVKASIYALVEPVVAVLAAVVILGQKYVLLDYIGTFAILAGVTLLVLKGGSDNYSGEE